MSGCFLCSPNASRTSRRVEVSRPVMMWYGLSLFTPLCLLLFLSLVLCVWDTLLPSLIIIFLPSFFFVFQVEVSPPVIGRVLEEEMVTALSVAFLGMEEEPPSDGMAEETGKPMQGVQTTQDPETSQLPASQSPQLERTPSPIRTVFPQTVLIKRLWEARLYLNKQVSHISLYNNVYLYFSFVPLFSPSLFFFLSFYFPFSFQVKPVLLLLWNQRILKVSVNRSYYVSFSFFFLLHLFPTFFFYGEALCISTFFQPFRHSFLTLSSTYFVSFPRIFQETRGVGGGGSASRG